MEANMVINSESVAVAFGGYKRKVMFNAEKQAALAVALKAPKPAAEKKAA